MYDPSGRPPIPKINSISSSGKISIKFNQSMIFDIDLITSSEVSSRRLQSSDIEINYITGYEPDSKGSFMNSGATRWEFLKTNINTIEIQLKFEEPTWIS